MGWSKMPHALFYTLEGTRIVGADGQFLGVISINTLDSDSITNMLGPHGSVLSDLSILKSIGPYGGMISDLSPFKAITSNPPSLFNGDTFIAYLTVNEFFHPRIDPNDLLSWLGIQIS